MRTTFFSQSHRKTNWLLSLSSMVWFVVFAVPPNSQSRQQAQDQSAQPGPDNTKKNLPTNHQDANRADQQSESAKDLKLTRKIRQALVQDKSLSTYAHNIKVIARGGVVHLKGPVRTQTEKDAVDAKATEIAGAANVKNEITVKNSTTLRPTL